jgi:hypothetical protein
MPTLILWQSDAGSGRCDARCHDAITPPATCGCICRGSNHGVGHEQALEYVRANAPVMAEGYRGMPGLRVALADEARQMTLFGGQRD